MSNASTAGPESMSDPNAAAHGSECEAAALIAHANLACVSQGLAHEIGNALQAASLHLEMVKLKLQGVDPNAGEHPSATALGLQLARIPPLITAWVDATLVDDRQEPGFDLKSLIGDAGMLVTVACRQRGIRLTVDDGDNELVVRGERFTTLHTTLWLIIQEMPFAGHGGEISLRCEPGAGRSASILIQVRRRPDADSSFHGIGSLGSAAGGREFVWLEMADTLVRSLGGEMSRKSVTELERECRLCLPLCGDDDGDAASVPSQVR